MTFLKKYTLGLVTVIFLGACSESPKQQLAPDADTQLYHNGTIISMDGEAPETIEALVVREGKIEYTGTLAEAEEKYAEAQKKDLEGKTLLPGFIDPHSHFGMVSNTMGQADLNPPPVGTTSSVKDIQQKLLAFKKDNNVPDDEWIFGWGYDESQLAEGRHPDKKEIDAVLPNNPVYLQHTSGHMGVANSAALRLMGVDRDSPNPDGGNIDRYPDSDEPNGLVQETAMYIFVENLMKILESKQATYFDQTQDYYAKNGITTAHDGMTTRDAIRFFQGQAEAGKFKIDLVALPGYAELNENIADSTLTWKTYKNGFKLQGTKIVADGSPQGKTAFFTEPFLTPVPGCVHHCRGLPSLSQEALNDLFVTAYREEIQLFTHCNGDATIDMVIESHENACAVLNEPLGKDRRTIAIHSQFVRPDQLETYAEYGIEPSFFTNHAFFWGDVHVENLGEERAFFLSPIATAHNMGLTYTNHSDATVTPIDPIFTLWTAINRTSRSGKIIGPAERATPYQALQAITINAAFQLFEEDSKGTLTVGKMADLVILNQNPLEVEPMDIKNIRVIETIKEGKTVYSQAE